MQKRPSPIAVSCGDPAGIGPEIAVKAWAALRGNVPFYWLGDPEHLPSDTPITLISDPQEATAICAESLPVFPIAFAAKAIAGQADARNAQGVINVIKTAVSHVQTGQAGGICTAPINKQVLIEGAGFSYPGHTEFLAALAGRKDVVMMLASPNLRVVPATIHIPLKDVPAALTPAHLQKVIAITHHDMQTRFAMAQPRIAISGLNPHAGEGGHMGREELEIITPLITKMRQEGMDITGPLPADTMFHEAAREKYDVAICMYHDQALIPVKALDFDQGVNVTLGLPFIRTSPDHGTGFDIAGKNIANPRSMIEALKLASKLSEGSPQ